ncbi:MAG: tRNA lysidine(34) synthetase TilS, partial [Gemmatimonadetes bacterium]|nr:tRNA lysidine(34) synthetase TilS [Gemmatimonadota bacterium]
MTVPSSLEERFLENMRGLELGAPPVRLLVAVSGGLDSVTLLYLLRFCARELPLEISVAHLDHAMRPDSASDARWVRGLCEAWVLPLVSSRLERRPAGETGARAARYRFLRQAALDEAARFVVTGHHADDQAETVLFRAVRGTGLGGLAGMPPISDAGVLRPLLPFWREELLRFARERRLAWREDSTNASADAARNVIRLEILPRLESEVAPAARRNLLRLAQLAGEAESALQREAARAEAEIVRDDAGWAILARRRLRAYDSTIGTRIVRNLLRRFGVVLGRTGTRRALQFIMRAPSGRVLALPDGVRIELELEAARVGRPVPRLEDEPLAIERLAPGEQMQAPVRIGGRAYLARVRVARCNGESETAEPGLHGLVPL